MVRQETVSDLKPAPYNPRKISAQQLETLKYALQRFGDLGGIVKNVRSGNLVGGHQRIKHLDPGWRITKKPHRDQVGTVAIGYIETPDFGLLGYREVDWDEVTEKAANLAANKIQGEWDPEKLAPILHTLSQLPEMHLTGFRAQEANLIIETIEHPTDFSHRENLIPKLDRTGPSIVQHQVWRLGEHRLVCGDARDPDAWDALMGDEKATLCITDPPYGVDYNADSKSKLRKVTGRRVRNRGRDDVEGDTDTSIGIAALPLIFGHMIDESVLYVCSGTDLAVDVINWCRENHVHYSTLMVWDKTMHVVSWLRYHPNHELIVYCGKGTRPGKHARWFGGKQETTIWRIPNEVMAERLHPTQKPSQLYERAMINSSGRGEIVVDPFAGSGTMLVAAEKHSRKARVMEIRPVYCQLMIKRWEIFTNKKAKPL